MNTDCCYFAKGMGIVGVMKILQHMNIGCTNMNAEGAVSFKGSM